MKNAIRFTLAVLITTAIACTSTPKEPKADYTSKAIVDSITNAATKDSTATSIQSDTVTVSE